MRVLLIIFTLLLSAPAIAQQQYKNLLHKPYKEKVLGVHALYRDLINISDSTQRAKQANELIDFARKNKDRGLELEIYFFQNFWNAFYQNQAKEVSLKVLKDQLEQVSRENIDFLRARALRALAEFYWKREQNYELAFEQYLLLDKELAKTKPEDYPEMARDLMQIGQSYYYFQDYDLAISYFKKAIILPENSFNTMVLNDARNTLGLCYQNLKMLDSADYYFNQVIQTRFSEAQVWKRIATGNLGNSMYMRKQYDKAIPLLQTDLQGATAIKDDGCAAGAATLLADIYREKGDLKQAQTFIKQAQYHINQSKQFDRLRILYPIISKWYAATGNLQQSKSYLDSSIVAHSRYTEKFNALKVLRAQQKVSAKQEQLQLATLSLEQAKKSNERNLFLLVVLVLLVVLILGYLILRKRQHHTELAKLKVESELRKAKDEINLFIYKINEQSKITQKFSDELKKIKNTESNERKMLEQTVLELRQAKILTDTDWLNFQKHFTLVFPGFIQKIRAEHNNITEAELRYLMMSRLQLSHKEMAQALGISPDAVRVTWNRVRKKLGGTLSDTPQSLVESVV